MKSRHVYSLKIYPGTGESASGGPKSRGVMSRGGRSRWSGNCTLYSFISKNRHKDFLCPFVRPSSSSVTLVLTPLDSIFSSSFFGKKNKNKKVIFLDFWDFLIFWPFLTFFRFFWFFYGLTDFLKIFFWIFWIFLEFF